MREGRWWEQRLRRRRKRRHLLRKWERQWLASCDGGEESSAQLQSGEDSVAERTSHPLQPRSRRRQQLRQWKSSQPQLLPPVLAASHAPVVQSPHSLASAAEWRDSPPTNPATQRSKQNESAGTIVSLRPSGQVRQRSEVGSSLMRVVFHSSTQHSYKALLL